MRSSDGSNNASFFFAAGSCVGMLVAGVSAYYYASAISALENRRREIDRAEMSLQLHQQKRTTSEPTTPRSTARKRKPFSRLGSGGGPGNNSGRYHESSSSSSSSLDEEDSKRNTKQESGSRAPPPSPQQFNSRLVLRSNSALEHKVVLNDVTDTETEDQSFKDNDCRHEIPML